MNGVYLFEYTSSPSCSLSYIIGRTTNALLARPACCTVSPSSKVLSVDVTIGISTIRCQSLSPRSFLPVLQTRRETSPLCLCYSHDTSLSSKSKFTSKSPLDMPTLSVSLSYCISTPTNACEATKSSLVPNPAPERRRSVLTRSDRFRFHKEQDTKRTGSRECATQE